MSKRSDKLNFFWFTLVALIAAFLCFYNLGKTPLVSWDESRYGSNAIEMNHHNDWATPYYLGEPDDWNVKPPLFVNLVRLSYKVWGENEFGLRFPSALSAFCLVLLLYWFIQRESGQRMAVLSIAMLLGSTGLIGSHTGRSGDTDSLFALLVLIMVIYVYVYQKSKSYRHIIIAGMVAGLAFWAKSTAIFIAGPGVILYFYLMGIKFNSSVRHLIIGGSVFLLFPLSWFIINQMFGAVFIESSYGGESSFSNTLIQDTFNRFFGDGEFQNVRKFDIILIFLDARFSIWGYAFLATLLGLIFMLIKNRQNLKSLIQSSPPLIILSVSFIIPYFTILQLSASAHGWYLLPVLPFIAILTAYGLFWISEKVRFFNLILIGLAIYTVGRRSSEVTRHDRSELKFFTQFHEIQNEYDCVLIEKTIDQRHLLYAQWNSSCIEYVSDFELDTISDNRNLLLLAPKEMHRNTKGIIENDQLVLIDISVN